VKDIAGTTYKIRQNKNKQKGQKRRQYVVAGRQQLNSAVKVKTLSIYLVTCVICLLQTLFLSTFCLENVAIIAVFE